MATEDEQEVTGKDVERVPTEIVKMNLTPMARKFLESASAASDLPPEEAEMSIIQAILAGTTVEEILGELGSLLKMEDYENRNIRVHGYRWQESNYESFPVYMVLDITEEGSDEHQAMGCGAKVCMAQVFALAENDLLPVDMFVKKSPKPTKRGFYPMRFLPAEIEEKF
jgi:hypothetical protein